MINDHTGRMATELPTTSTNGDASKRGEGNFTVKTGLARMLKGGVIMDVVNAEQVSLSADFQGGEQAQLADHATRRE
jgi:pyridoxal 5'-phosphate synthase pdxS subunit